MAKPTTFTFGQFLIQVGDGADPEVFSQPCGFTQKGFNQTANMQETSVPDCDDPDAPAYIERAVDTLSSEVTASGVLAGEAFETYQEWFDSALSRNCRIYLKGQTGGYYAGKYVLSAFNATNQRGQKTNVDITLSSDGQWVWTPGS
jgi:hypothetical protein